jgi:hypothetical protein
MPFLGFNAPTLRIIRAWDGIFAALGKLSALAGNDGELLARFSIFTPGGMTSISSFLPNVS